MESIEIWLSPLNSTFIKTQALKSSPSFLAPSRSKWQKTDPPSASYLESGYLVRVARLLVYMWPPTSMCTGAFDLVSWAGSGIPWAARGETGDRVRDSRDMLLPS